MRQWHPEIYEIAVANIHWSRSKLYRSQALWIPLLYKCNAKIKSLKKISMWSERMEHEECAWCVLINFFCSIPLQKRKFPSTLESNSKRDLVHFHDEHLLLFIRKIFFCYVITDPLYPLSPSLITALYLQVFMHINAGKKQKFPSLLSLICSLQCNSISLLSIVQICEN